MIRQAGIQDIDKIAASYEELLLFEEENGTHSNWKRGVYPVRATAETAVREGALYVLEEKGCVEGSLILNGKQAGEYSAVPWAYEAAAEKVLVGHTLCVPPSAAGKGHGEALMRFAISFGRDYGYKVFRLDTWAHNDRAAALYRKLGFRLAGRGDAFFQGKWKTELIYFEKELKQC